MSACARKRRQHEKKRQQGAHAEGGLARALMDARGQQHARCLAAPLATHATFSAQAPHSLNARERRRRRAESRGGRGSKREEAGGSEEDAERVGPKARQSCSCVGSHLLNLRGDGGSAHGYATRQKDGAVENILEQVGALCVRRGILSPRTSASDMDWTCPQPEKQLAGASSSSLPPLPTSLSKCTHSRPAFGH